MGDVEIAVFWGIILIVIAISIRVLCGIICRENANSGQRNAPVRRRVVRRIRIDPDLATVRDRQGNIFTITDESGATRNYADFFVVEPNSEDARVRAQLEKDDKDLPTYDEVMAATLAASAASYAAANRHGFDNPTRSANSNTSIDISSPSSTNIPIDVPPYSEVDPNPLTPIVSSNQNAATTITLPIISSTSTSCALQISDSNTNSAGSSTESAVRSVAGIPSNESHVV